MPCQVATNLDFTRAGGRREARHLRIETAPAGPGMRRPRSRVLSGLRLLGLDDLPPGAAAGLDKVDPGRRAGLDRRSPGCMIFLMILIVLNLEDSNGV
jgi:hypothetical protein